MSHRSSYIRNYLN